jgi:hypothetical protein
MCNYCETNGLDIDVGMHVECEFCGTKTAWMNTDYVYDTAPSSNGGTKVIARALACNPCRNILKPKG